MKENFRLPSGKKETPKYILDQKDRLILNEIQRNFPVTHRPFLALGRKLKLREKEVMERVQRLKDVGIIRRIGASFSARAVGFRSTLCAARVHKDKIEQFVAVVNTYPGVTHNYEREGDYNIWFTLIAPSKKKDQSDTGRNLPQDRRQGNPQPPCFKDLQDCRGFQF